jgi:hypothetical protein
MTLYYDDNAGTDRFSLQDFEPSFGLKLNTAVREAWLESYGPVLTDAVGAYRRGDGPKISAQEARDRIAASGLKINLSPKDGEYTQAQIDFLLERQRELTTIRDVRERTPWDLGSVVRGGAMFGAGILDPLNLATAFVPWTRAIPAAQGLRAATLSTQLGTRTLGRAGVGSIDAGISTAALEPFYYGLRQNLGDDYDGYDAMANIAFGTLFGGGIHAGGGAGLDAFRRAMGRALPSDAYAGLSVDEIQLVQGLRDDVAAGMDIRDVARVLETYTPAMRRAAGFPDPEPVATPDAAGDGAPARVEDGIAPPARTADEMAAPETARRNDLTAYIRDTGGLSPTLAFDAGGENGMRINRKMPGLVKNTGARNYDELTERLIEDGFLPAGMDSGSAEATEMAADLLTRAINGERIVRIEDQIREAELRAREEFDEADRDRFEAELEARLEREAIQADTGPVDDTPSAEEVVLFVSPETREAALRSAVAQSAEGRVLDVEALVLSDEAAGAVTGEREIADAAARNRRPEAIRVADFDASAEVDARNATAPKWQALTDAEAAEAEAAALLADTVKAGDHAFKYSRAQADWTQTPEFQAWFGDSKVVGPDGEPLVVYHGTMNGDVQFREGTWAFFSNNPKVADTYTRGRPSFVSRSERGAAVYPVYLKMDNPLVVRLQPNDIWEQIEFDPQDGGGPGLYSTDQIATWARRNGHDGVVFENIIDPGSGGYPRSAAAREAMTGSTYVVFDAKQIKSSTGNRGTFDPTNPDIRYSRTPLYQQGITGDQATTVIDASIRQAFGSDSAALMDAGRVRLVAVPNEIPGGSHPADVKAATAPDGTVYIVAENVSPAEARGLLLHEVGVHVGMEQMLGPQVFGEVLTQLDKAIEAGESWAQAARAAVPADTLPAHVREEQLAYLVQNAPDLPIVQRILAAVRAWAYRNFEFARERMTLTEADFRAMAVSALHHAARGQEVRAGGLVPAYSRGPIPDPSPVAAELKRYDDAVKRAKAFSGVLRAAADKLDNDAQATAAMRAAMPDITPQEIDDLLTGLRSQVKGLRNAARTARAMVDAENQAGIMQSDAMRAADMLANNLQMAAVIEKRNAALNMNVRLKATSFVDQFRDKGLDFEGFAALLVGSERVRQGSRVSIDAEYKGFRGEWLGGMIHDIERLGLMREFKSGTFDRDIYDALWRLGAGEKADLSGLPQQAVELARIVNKYQDDARNTRNRFGAWIRDLQGYITRQSHDPFKIREVSDADWIAFVKDRIDLPKMQRLGLISEIDPMGSLRGLYDDFAAGVHMKAVAGEEDGVALGRGSNLAKRESVSRAIYFKDGLSAYEYNQRFGTGTLAESVVAGIDQAARSAALLKNLGTNPEATLTRLLDEYEASLAPEPERRAKFRSQRGALMNMMAQVDGSINVPGNVTGAKIGAFLRAWQNMARLGGALISSFSDLAGYGAELRYAQGKGLLSGVGDGIGRLAQGRAKDERAAIVSSLGVFHESMLGAISARFDSPDLVHGKMAAAMQQFFRLNGLAWWTETLRDGAALTHSHYMATQAGKAFDAIDPEFRRMLGLYNIDAGKWDLLRMGQLQQADGQMYLTPEGLRTVPRAAFENYIQQVGRTVNDATVQNLQDDLAQALRVMTVDRAHHAVLEPNARTRAWMQRGTKPGTVPGEILRFIGQFKSFSVAMTQTVLGREIYGRGYDTLGEYLKKGHGDMLGLAYMVGLYGVLGYGAMAAKDLLKGRTPRDPLDPKTFAAAMAQGGGLGLYGDFLFGEYSRMGRSFTASLAGPVLGNLDTLTDLWTRLRNGDDVAAASFKALLDNTPFLNLYWARPVLDYLVLYHIQEALNPGFLRRMEKRIERDNGQTFILPPSQVVR